MSEMAQFKIYVQHELEKRLQAMDNLGYDDYEDEETGETIVPEVKIAQITFAFRNAQMVKWL